MKFFVTQPKPLKERLRIQGGPTKKTVGEREGLEGLLFSGPPPPGGEPLMFVGGEICFDHLLLFLLLHTPPLEAALLSYPLLFETESHVAQAILNSPAAEDGLSF